MAFKCAGKCPAFCSISQSQSELGPVCGSWAYLLGGLFLGTGKVRGGQSRRQDVTVNRLGGCSPGDLAWLLATPSF